MSSAQLFALAALAVLWPVSAALPGLAIPPNTGKLCNFIVFASSGITTGSNGHYDGNFGISPTTINAVTIPPGIQPVQGQSYYTAYPQVIGEVHGPGMLADQAHSDMLSVYNYAGNEAPSVPEDSISPVLDGLVFIPGVYRWSSEVALSAAAKVTLVGAYGQTFIMQIGSAFNTGAASRVVLEGGVTPDSVFWIVGSAAGLGARTHFNGLALAGTTVVVGADVTIRGGIYAHGSAVVMSSAFTAPGSCPGANPSVTISALASTATALSPSQGAAKFRRSKADAPRWDREVVRSATRQIAHARRSVAGHGKSPVSI